MNRTYTNSDYGNRQITSSGSLLRLHTRQPKNTYTNLSHSGCNRLITNPHTKKGLYFSFDAVIASVIFILTIISVISYWHSVHTGMKQEDLMLMEEAIRVSDMVLLPDQGKGFGFTETFDNKTIVLSKVSGYADLVGTNENKIKTDVGTPYNVYITFDIFDPQDNWLNSGTKPLEIGEPYKDAKMVGKFTRIASAYDDDEGNLIVKISVFLYN